MSSRTKTINVVCQKTLERSLSLGRFLDKLCETRRKLSSTYKARQNLPRACNLTAKIWALNLTVYCTLKFQLELFSKKTSVTLVLNQRFKNANLIVENFRFRHSVYFRFQHGRVLKSFKRKYNIGDWKFHFQVGRIID